ncbi:MAG TPA: TolC family protein [Saprospiraceae bacterium]|nr:TolC family protein [Saprospiraceae bacterium]
MINKRIKLIALYCSITVLVYSQHVTSLTIDSCFEMAKRNFPLVKQYALIDKSKSYSIDNANKSYLPQFNIGGQATYQSEVTHIPISLPNVKVSELSKDQYKLYGEVSQAVTDLFTTKDYRELISANAEIEGQKIEVELYKLKERISNLFFGILLIDAQIQQTELLKKDIQSGIDKVSVAIAYGTALKSSADNLKAELLKANQRTIELKSNRSGYAAMLSYFIDQTVDETTFLIKPSPQIILSAINRPELKLFDLQKRTFEVQNKLIKAKNLPRLNLFLQGGLGRPALNMLSNDVNLYYLAGLRLNWNLAGLYTYKNEKQILSLNQKGLDIQKEIFLFNTNVILHQQNSEVSKMQELIETDNSIITLRESIKNKTKVQLENGTATSTDYLIDVNAQDQAAQNLILHQIQFLMTQYNYQITSGNK